MLRTNTCGELTKKDVDKKISLCGWNHARRDHGGVIFVDLRDRYGLTQVVFDPSHNKKVHSVAEHLKREDVLRVSGKVRYRGKGLENPKMHTGEIEIIADDLEIINSSLTPPLEIDDKAEANEEIRLRYRYLDLRRPIMQQRLITRSKVAQSVREYFTSHDFIEIETPILVKSTPEGARDYVVPSRVHNGKFYALPQSPQLYKQILMVAGMDRYFQLARCLRDEDLRADRQPEHTQIDVEMSFVEVSDVHEMIEGLYKQIFKKVLGIELKTPFKKITYDEAMEKYGIDKPDLRFGLELVDVSKAIKGSEFGVFNSILEHNGIVKVIVVPQELGRNELDAWIKFAQEHGAKGLAWMKVTGKDAEGKKSSGHSSSELKLESNIVKFFSAEIQEKILKATKAKAGNTLMFVADKPKIANEVLAKIRLKLGHDLKLIEEHDTKNFSFCWVTDFPLFEWNEDEERWEPAHHMFCMPKKEDLSHLQSDPGKVKCTQYDLVLNGVELGSGSIRINDPKIQEEVMKVIGLSHEQAEKKFGFLLEAFKYGAPVHGGIGIGLDRTVALMLGLHDIREVIAFPKNKAAECPMDGSPNDVEEKQLKELGIKFENVKKK
ncbi:aspartate--tRNA ligase [Candidatus Woesearchaeota archaeon]|nr:aspartate--tRNA ligase [Candidatus Woesearchaeota archaeon]